MVMWPSMPTGTKITVTLDPALLARIDAARAPGQTRSGFIAAALTASLDRSAAPRPVNGNPDRIWPARGVVMA